MENFNICAVQVYRLLAALNLLSNDKLLEACTYCKVTKCDLRFSKILIFR